jgi:PPOX class probable F420-dependent enzyme
VSERKEHRVATIPESHRDLLTGTVVLATIGPSGQPHVSAIVVRLDGGDRISTSLSTARQKYRNLIAEPRATLFAADPTISVRTIEVRADVEVIDDPDKGFAREFSQLFGFDVDQIDEPHHRRVEVVFHPTKVNLLEPSAFFSTP